MSSLQAKLSLLKFVRNSTFGNKLKMYDHLEQKYLMDYVADSENFKMRFQAALSVNQSVSETLKFRQISSVYIYILSPTFSLAAFFVLLSIQAAESRLLIKALRIRVVIS